MKADRAPEELDRAAWNVLLVLLHEPERDTPAAITAGLPGVLPREGHVLQILRALLPLDYVAEHDGRWSLSGWCRQAIEADSGRPRRRGAAHPHPRGIPRRKVIAALLRRGQIRTALRARRELPEVVLPAAQARSLERLGLTSHDLFGTATDEAP